MKQHLNKISYALLALMVLAACIGGQYSCDGPKRTAARQTKYMSKFDKLKNRCDADSNLKIVPPAWSAKTFPVLTSSNVSTTYKQGEEHAEFGPDFFATCDSAVAEAIRAYKAANGGVLDGIDIDSLVSRLNVKVPCPPAKTTRRTDTVFRDSVVTVERTDRLEAEQIKCRQLAKEVDGQKAVAEGYMRNAKKYKARFSWALALLVLVLGIWAQRKYRQLQLAKLKAAGKLIGMS